MTTESDVTLQFANSSQKVADFTAVTTANPNTGRSEGCFATGGIQPPLPPPGDSWYKFGSSPKIGQCYFGDLPKGSTNYFDFYSAACQSAGQVYDFTAYLTSDSSGRTPSQNVCTIPSYSLPQANNHFSIDNQFLYSLTISGTGLISTYGQPQLVVYDSSGNIVGSPTTASSVAGDGSSVTFPFPSIGSGFYMFGVKNFNGPSGQYNTPAVTYYSVGHATSLSSPLGVDAAQIQVITIPCYPPNPYPNCGTQTSTTSVVPIFTQYYNGTVYYQGGSLAVGTYPVSVKLYGTIGITTGQAPYSTQTTTVQPANAIVSNSGSGNVSILDLPNRSVRATITVGSQPMGIAVNGTTKAYVANYGSGTVSEIDLQNLVVSRTVTVGTGAQSVTLDPGGTAIWVGGSNYLKKVALSSFAVVTSVPISGAVTSLSMSGGQNELVYTTTQNCCTSNGNSSANELSLTTLVPQGGYGPTSTSPYAQYTMNATLPNWSLGGPSATAVSAQWANGIAASATPTGFVIYDLVSHHTIMQGTTPTPVRGIASDPNNTVVYMTLPDSNEYLTIPLPQ